MLVNRKTKVSASGARNRLFTRNLTAWNFAATSRRYRSHAQTLSDTGMKCEKFATPGQRVKKSCPSSDYRRRNAHTGRRNDIAMCLQRFIRARSAATFGDVHCSVPVIAKSPTAFLTGKWTSFHLKERFHSQKAQECGESGQWYPL